MDILNILSQTRNPRLYEKGTATMWTDEYISEQLLKIHLNTELDLASRKMETVERTSRWILEKAGRTQMDILDLGCGPGLYAGYMAKKGHRVTGIDFSKTSITHAKQQAEGKMPEINYIQANYLEYDFGEDKFDLVILIYTDFGVLLPGERKVLLQKINRLLKKGGMLIFDVMNDKNIEMKGSPQTWEYSEKGFWKASPYLALSGSFLYPEEKVILYQHVIIDGNESIDVYRFWTHYFSNADIEKELDCEGFINSEFFTDVLPEGDIWNGDNVTFCVTLKG